MMACLVPQELTLFITLLSGIFGAEWLARPRIPWPDQVRTGTLELILGNASLAGFFYLCCELAYCCSMEYTISDKLHSFTDTEFKSCRCGGLLLSALKLAYHAVCLQGEDGVLTHCLAVPAWPLPSLRSTELACGGPCPALKKPTHQEATFSFVGIWEKMEPSVQDAPG